MFTTGSKTCYGLAAASALGAILFGNFGQKSIMTFSLIGLFVVFAWLGSVASHSRDNTVSAMNETAVQTAAANSAPAANSLWPLSGALAGVLLVVGVVTDARYFVAGLVAGIATIVQWMVQAWSDRASADRNANAQVRSTFAHPWELPVAAGLGLAAIVWAFSRIMLAVSSTIGLVLFSGFGVIILLAGTLVAAKRKLSRTVITGVCTVAAAGLLAGGVAGAINGQNHHLTEENEHVKEFRHQVEESGRSFHCGEESDEVTHELFDEKSSGGVAATAGAYATLTLTEAKTLELHQFEGSLEGSDTLLIDKGNVVGLRFKSELEGEHRLTVFGGNEVFVENKQERKIATVFCTQNIEEGEEQYLIVRLPRSSVVTGEEFYAEVPGVEGAKIKIVVP